VSREEQSRKDINNGKVEKQITFLVILAFSAIGFPSRLRFFRSTRELSTCDFIFLQLFGQKY
jgi:hypothetical protein